MKRDKSQLRALGKLKKLGNQRWRETRFGGECRAVGLPRQADSVSHMRPTGRPTRTNNQQFP